MNITTCFDFNEIQFDKENDVILMTSIMAPKINLDKERVPLNLSLVLDVSGSMSGEKIKMLKATASKLIQQLTDRDTVGVVTFTDYVSEVFKPSSMTGSVRFFLSEHVRNEFFVLEKGVSDGMEYGYYQD